jgi:preprotein translocase subunit SecY
MFAIVDRNFTYFYTAITVPTNKMADDLKKSKKRWIYSGSRTDTAVVGRIISGTPFCLLLMRGFPAFC